MHQPVLVTPPASPPVGVSDVKQFLRDDAKDQNAVIDGLIAAAVAMLDGPSGLLGRAIVTQSWRQDFDSFCRELRLPLAAAGITSVIWQCSDGTLSTIASGNYALKGDELGAFLRFEDAYEFPSDLYETAAVRVTFTAGRAVPAVSSDLKLVIRQLVAYWYADREAVGRIPDGIRSMLFRLRLNLG